MAELCQTNVLHKCLFSCNYLVFIKEFGNNRMQYLPRCVIRLVVMKNNTSLTTSLGSSGGCCAVSEVISVVPTAADFLLGKR